jgi:hypothetical protein
MLWISINDGEEVVSMSKYKSKQQLVDEITKEKTILEQVLSNLDNEKVCQPGVCEDWSAKDILCHLAEWQQMVMNWYEEGSSGKTPEVPGKGYKWSQLPELNNAIYEEFKGLSWDEAQEFFGRTEKEIMRLLLETEETTLLAPGLQPWMNNNTLIAYIGSSTASHYKWASGLIKKFLKAK